VKLIDHYAGGAENQQRIALVMLHQEEIAVIQERLIAVIGFERCARPRLRRRGSLIRSDDGIDQFEK
jgi:hypothetical protein